MQALGLIETKGLIAAIESADAMLKAADVSLLEKVIVGGGLVSIAITGDVGAVKAAVEAGGAAVRKINSTLLVSEHVIPRPHQELDNIIISAVSLKSVDIPTIIPAKTESREEMACEIIENDTIENDTAEIPVEEIVIEDLVVEDLEGKEFLTEKTITSFENGDMLTDQSAKTESEEEMACEIIEEDTIENDTAEVLGEEIVVENLVVEDSESKEFLTENTSTSLQMDLSKLHNKEAVDKMILECGLEEVIEVLSKFKVVELRNLAREYKNFGIAGRKVSKADKRLLLTEFRKYYGNN